MKKICLFLLIFISISTSAQNAIIEEPFVYNLISDSTAELSGYVYSDNKMKINIEIPDYISFQQKKFKVIGISKKVFENNTYLISVKFPENLQYIGDAAFSGCFNLSSEIVFPKKLINIGVSAFENCTNLKKVKLSGNIISICKNAFANCNVDSISLPESNLEMGDGVFKNCQNLKFIYIPKTLTIIPDYCFYNCRNLSSVNFHEHIQSIGKYAFRHCVNFVEIVLGENISQIGYGAFYNCINLKKIYMSKNKTFEINTFIDVKVKVKYI